MIANQTPEAKLAMVQKTLDTFLEVYPRTPSATAQLLFDRLYDVLQQPVLPDAFLEKFAKEVANEPDSPAHQ